MIWHSSQADKIIANFGVDPKKGLPTGVADIRLEEYGQNVINITKKTSIKKSIFKYLKNYSNVLVILSTIISFLVYLIYDNSKWYFPVFSLFVLAFYIAINIYTVKKSEAIISGIKHKSNPKATVLRDGIIKKLDASFLVPGDIIILKAGDYIPADARLIESSELRCNEKFVTGETVASEKNPDAVLEDIADIKQRLNMVYSGSSVISGSGKAVVTETGMNCEIGKQVSVLKEFDSSENNAKEHFALIGKFAGIILLFSCIVFFITAVIINFHNSTSFAVILSEAFVNSAALLISVLPEGLPIIAGTAVSLAVLQLLKDDIIVKNFDAFNKLPDISLICADKTGVLTKNDMSTVDVYTDGKAIPVKDIINSSSACALIKLAALCTNQTAEDVDSTMYKDPTELAIVKTCISVSNETQEEYYRMYPRVCKIPFDPELKIMTSVNMIDGVPVAITKGAPGTVLSICGNSEDQNIQKQISEYTSNAYRVIAVAYKQLSQIPSDQNDKSLQSGLQFIGLIAIQDALQENIVADITECADAGIKTVMITGDHSNTAKSVARRLGILKDENTAINGAELENMSEEELYDSLKTCSVFSRISPFAKERIIRTFSAQNECVAITGDSVNDAAALQTADVGIAMGSSRTDVAKGAADIILNNNGYSSIVKAISVSKKLIFSLRKAYIYLFGCNIGEFLAIFLSLLIFKSFPLIALQLLFVNLLTDSAPVFSIISDTIKNPYKLKRCADSDKKLFNSYSAISISVQAVMIAIVTVLGCALGKGFETDFSYTTTFTVLIFSQLFNMITAKSESYFWKSHHFFKSPLNYILLSTVFITIILVLTGTGTIIGLPTIPFSLFCKCILLSFIVLLSGEITKFGIYLFKALSSRNHSKTVAEA